MKNITSPFVVWSLVLIVVLNILINKVERLQHLDEYIYFSYQLVKTNGSSKIQLFNTNELKGDSLIRYINSIKGSNNLFLVNLPLEKTEELPDNVLSIYDLYEDLNYTAFNIKLTSADKLYTIASFLRTKYDDGEHPYINYTGDHNSYNKHYPLSYDSLQTKSPDIILIGYAGEHFDPILLNGEVDSTEMWFTPKFEMYDLVLKGNIIDNILRDNFIYKPGAATSFILSLLMYSSVCAYLLILQTKSYLKFKLFQLALGIASFLSTILFFKVGVFLPFTLLLLVIFFIGEILYWISRRSA